jgi:hypothetical protein
MDFSLRMNRLFITGLMILASFAELMAQDIEVDELDSTCSCKATLADSIFSQFKRENVEILGNATIQDARMNGRERIDFLNADFKTNVFSAACEVKFVDFLSATGVHFGIIDMGIREKDKAKCLRMIKSSGRRTFKVKVLTRFQVIERRDELVVMYSETPNVPAVSRILDAR